MWLDSDGVQFTFDIVPEQLPLHPDVCRVHYLVYLKGHEIVSDRSVYVLGGRKEAAKLIDDWNYRANGEYMCEIILVTKA